MSALDFAGMPESAASIARREEIAAILAAGRVRTQAMKSEKTETIVSPIPMLIWRPECGERHVDQGEFKTKPHHTHACQQCGHVWRPAIVATVGVKFLPGFKDKE